MIWSLKEFLNLNALEKIEYLRQLHRFFNKELFNNVLREDVFIDIQNINKRDGDDALACYIKILPYMNVPAILFRCDFAERFNGTDIEETELYEQLVTTMLHEMIHQYCDENGIDDSNHNDNFMDVAEQFGLYSYYKNNKGELEYIDNDEIRCKLGLAEL